MPGGVASGPRIGADPGEKLRRDQALVERLPYLAGQAVQLLDRADLQPGDPAVPGHQFILGREHRLSLPPTWSPGTLRPSRPAPASAARASRGRRPLVPERT